MVHPASSLKQVNILSTETIEIDELDRINKYVDEAIKEENKTVTENK